MMKVFIDGKQPKKSIENDVKVIWEDVDVTIEDQELNGQLHVTATSEGFVMDFFDSESSCDPLITQSITLEDFINFMQNNT
jgi:hypothetical protein